MELENMLMRNRPSLAIVCFVMIGIVVSIVGYFLTSSTIEEKNALRLSRYAERVTEAVRQQISGSTAALRAIQGLDVASGSVRREDFRNFLHKLEDRDGIQALEWIPRVSASEREDYEARARRAVVLR